MAKLVLLSQGLTGRTHELTVDKTTIGRVEDNSFPITEPSVSSHNCEVLLRGAEVVVKDLNSTNGSYINGE
jgi:pSer/pThr/pTyr-binding forkhead associated (FHA) protein